MDGSRRSAEKRVYAKGYAAGRARQAKDLDAEHQLRRDRAFWQRAFMAAVPEVMNAQNWTMDGKEATTLPDRIELAARAADEAVRRARNRYKL